jgi:hypothetical protein
LGKNFTTTLATRQFEQEEKRWRKDFWLWYEVDVEAEIPGQRIIVVEGNPYELIRYVVCLREVMIGCLILSIDNEGKEAIMVSVQSELPFHGAGVKADGDL